MRREVESGESWDEQLLLTSTKAIDSARTAKNGQPDWDAVKRAVAASEPPRMNDIPAHCKFIQKFGGTSDHRYLMDMISYLDKAMPEGRIVSGNFLEKLASLRMPPKELIPRIANACVIAQACGDKERESVGCTINEGHVKSLITTKKAMALRGEAIINRAYMLASDAGDQPTAIDAVGKLSWNLILFIFELSDAYESMDDILQEFLASIGVGTFSQAASSTDDRAPKLSLEVRYTPDGNDAGRITVVNMGFDVGSVIEPKKGNEDEDEQYVIKYVNDDGSVGVQRIKTDGSESADITIVEMDSLVNNHRHAHKRLTLLEGYPESAAIDSDEFKTFVLKGAVALAVKRLSNDAEYTKMTFRAQKYPKDRLFAIDPAEKGCLRVVPVTHKVNPDASAAGASADVVVVGGEKMVLQRNVSTECASEFFIMRVVHEEKKANMKIKVFKENVDGIEVKVPCAVNFKAIGAGDEVVLWKLAPTKTAPKAKAVAAMLEPPAKKAKK